MSDSENDKPESRRKLTSSWIFQKTGRISPIEFVLICFFSGFIASCIVNWVQPSPAPTTTTSAFAVSIGEPSTPSLAPDCAMVTDPRDSSQYCHVAIFPKDIKLRFVTPGMLHEMADKGGVGYADAFTYVNRSPCEIVMPTNVELLVQPREGRVYYGNDDLKELLGHEIAHCFAGAWHPSNWNQILFNRQTDHYGDPAQALRYDLLMWLPPIHEPLVWAKLEGRDNPYSFTLTVGRRG